MGQSGAVVVSLGREKDLSFLLQATKGFAVDYAVAVALKAGSDIVLFFGARPAATAAAEAGIRMQKLPLDILCLLTNAHADCCPMLRD